MRIRNTDWDIYILKHVQNVMLMFFTLCDVYILKICLTLCDVEILKLLLVHSVTLLQYQKWASSQAHLEK